MLTFWAKQKPCKAAQTGDDKALPKLKVCGAPSQERATWTLGKLQKLQALIRPREMWKNKSEHWQMKPWPGAAVPASPAPGAWVPRQELIVSATKATLLSFALMVSGHQNQQLGSLPDSYFQADLP